MRITGKRLSKQEGLDVRHSLYRETGDYYHVLKAFPAVNHDEKGYVIWPDKRSYYSDPRLRIYVQTNQVSLREPLNTHPRWRPRKTRLPRQL